MKCVFCGHSESKVTDSRYLEEDNSIRRRRECLNCGKRFTTYEKIEISPILVVKRDGSRQGFDREKIKQGIIKACDKRKVSFEQIEKIVDDIEKQIASTLNHEVTSEEIGNIVMDKLKEIDEVAYIRFASVYRQFSDVTHFVSLLNEFKKK